MGFPIPPHNPTLCRLVLLRNTPSPTFSRAEGGGGALVWNTSHTPTVCRVQGSEGWCSLLAHSPYRHALCSGGFVEHPHSPTFCRVEDGKGRGCFSVTLPIPTRSVEWRFCATNPIHTLVSGRVSVIGRMERDGHWKRERGVGDNRRGKMRELGVE